MILRLRATRRWLCFIRLRRGGFGLSSTRRRLRRGRAGRRLRVERRMPEISVRTGDTSAKERARFRKHPGGILITTPESLYLLLTSEAGEGLRSVETVIVDEIHALVPSKRGAHMALSLERLEALTGRRLQRIGLSATQRPLEEVARFLGGAETSVNGIGLVTFLVTESPQALERGDEIAGVLMSTASDGGVKPN